MPTLRSTSSNGYLEQVWNRRREIIPDLPGVPCSSYLGDCFGVVVGLPRITLDTSPFLFCEPNLFALPTRLFCVVAADVLVILGGILLMDT
jgi:hypothetical protein